MSDAIVPALLVDIEATTVRFALRDPSPDGNGIANVVRREVDWFASESSVTDAIGWAFGHFDLTAHDTDVLMSVAAPVLGDTVNIPSPEKWSFTKSGLLEELRKKLPVRSLEAVNDMLACGLALPRILNRGDVIKLGAFDATSTDGFPVLLICARPNLGACGLAPVPYRASPSDTPVPIWVPIQAEPGGMSLAPIALENGAQEAELAASIATIASKLTFKFAGLQTAHDFLSPEAITRMYDILSGTDDRAAPSIKGLAASPISETAAELMEIWSSLFGLWVRSLALAYGARGGVYVFGVTPLAFFRCERASRNQELFRRSFEIATPVPHYLSEIPTYLVEHDDPFLEGAAQLGA